MNLKCNCGGVKSLHTLGEYTCYREIVPRAEEPTEFGINIGKWKFVGEPPITDFTLRQQRGYSYHIEENLWSKPKARPKEWFECKAWD